MAALGDYISIKHGYAFKGDNISAIDNGVILVTPGNFAIGGGFKEDKCKYFTGDYPADYILKPNDLIVTMTDLSKNGDTLGFGALIPQSKKIYLHNQRIGLVSINSELLTKEYLYWYMRTPAYQKRIVATSSGSTVKHTSPGRIYEIEIKLPSLHRQSQIVSILKSLDDKIAINNQINANLEKQAQAIFFDMFGLPSDNWKYGILSDIADITMGQSPKGSSYNESGTGTVFFQGRAEFGFRFPTRRLFTTEPKRMARENDVLMSVRAPVGDLNIAREDCCIGRGLAAIRAKDGNQSFLIYMMYSLREKLDIYNGEGTVFGSISGNALNNIQIAIPPIALIREFEKLVSPMDKAIRNNYEENLHLQTLRDELLPRLMSGELDVSTLEL